MDNKNKSSCWQYFEKIDKEFSKCKICQRLLKTCGNTTNMIKHLHHSHTIDVATRHVLPRKEEKSRKRTMPTTVVGGKSKVNSSTAKSPKTSSLDPLTSSKFKILPSTTETIVIEKATPDSEQKQKTQKCKVIRIKNEKASTNEIFDEIEEPFDFVGDLTASYLNEDDESLDSSGPQPMKYATKTTEDTLSNLNKTLEKHLSTFRKIVFQQNDNFSKKLKHLPFYEYVDTLLVKLPEEKVQILSKRFLDEVHNALQEQQRSSKES